MMSFWEGTQKTLGKIIKRPKLTEKLLKRPPFRFIHDIVQEVIKATGFGDGLYAEEELDSSTIKTKDAKIAFLTKIFSLVSCALGRKLSVRPQKVVSGIEAEATNEFLCFLAGVASNPNVDREECVNSVLGGESKSVKQRPKAAEGGSARPSSRKGPRGDRRVTWNTEQMQEEEKTLDERKEKVEQKREHSPPKPSTPPPQTPPSPPHDEDSEDEEVGGQEMNEVEVSPESDRMGHPVNVRYDEDDEGSGSSPGSEGSELDEADKGEEEHVAVMRFEDGRLPGAFDEPQTTSSPSPPGSPVSSLPLHANRPSRIARPQSARRAPPRVKSNVRTVENIVAAEQQRPDSSSSRGSSRGASRGSAAGVIVEQEETVVDDDDTVEVVYEEEVRRNVSSDATDKGEHGALVRNLMDARAEDDDDVGENLADRSRREEIEQEREKMQGLMDEIQHVCKTTNSLGKILDFLQEDVDAMNRELENWRSISQKNEGELENGLAETQRSLQPLQNELSEVENRIEQENQKIRRMKAQILQNDQKIENLLRIVASRQR